MKISKNDRALIESDLERQPPFRRLRATLKEHLQRPVFFSGAGASQGAGLPNWAEFRDALYDELENYFRTMGRTEIDPEIVRKYNAGVTNWDKIEVIKEYIPRGLYEERVRQSLDSRGKIPLYYKKVWDLNPAGLVTLNLDGILRNCIPGDRLASMRGNLVGRDAGRSRFVFKKEGFFTAELHGTVGDPETWVITKSDLEALKSNDAYRSFMISLFQQCIVFYGISIDDDAVLSQLKILQKQSYANGLYFLIARGSINNVESRVIDMVPIQQIIIPENFSWEVGFSVLVDNIVNFVPVDEVIGPVLSPSAKAIELVPSNILQAKTPNEIRNFLEGVSPIFFDGDDFDFEAYRRFCEEYDSALHLASRVRLGTSNSSWFGYELKREIGSGNFGRVYEADAEDLTHVAVKIAHEDVRDNPEKLNNFRRGVQSMRILTGSNISGVVSIISATELPPSIVMEYIEGVNIDDISFQKDLSLHEIFSISSRIIEIVLRCHNHISTIFHRDLRPSNIMLTGEWYHNVLLCDVIVLDFDLSWYTGASDGEFILSSSQALGYLAPEQLNLSSKISSRSALVDVFGIGMLIYFMLTKKHPIANACLSDEWRAEIRAASLKTGSHPWRSLPRRIERLLAGCTDGDQKNRPYLALVGRFVKIIAQLAKDGWATDYEAILEEICSRAYGVEYTYNDGKFYIKSTDGKDVMLWVDQYSDFNFQIQYLVSPHVNRKTIGQNLNRAVNEVKQELARRDVKKSRAEVRHGGAVVHFIERAPQNISELEATVRTLAKFDVLFNFQ